MTLKFSVPKCPECGGIAVGVKDLIPGLAGIVFEEDGETAEYSGGTDMWWDDQYTPEDENGEVQLRCDEDHWWDSKMEEIT